MTTPNVTFWAFRYALGRSTYAVPDVIEAIRDDVETGTLTGNDRRTMVAEISRALDEGRAGHPDIDAPEWAKLRDDLMRQL